MVVDGDTEAPVGGWGQSDLDAVAWKIADRVLEVTSTKIPPLRKRVSAADTLNFKFLIRSSIS